MKAARKHVYRPDDRVTIVEPLVVTRVGYPMGFHDTRAALEAAHGVQVDDALRAVVKDSQEVGWPDHLVDVWPTLRAEVLNAMTKADLRRKGYGGRERTVHTKPDERLRGKEARVTGKRTVRTGTYRPGYHDHWSGESEPPYLADVRSHVILEVEVYTEPSQEVFSCPEVVEIEECHVRPAVMPWTAQEEAAA